MATGDRPGPGGIARLSNLISRFERQLEYDLWTLPGGGIDLRDLYRPSGGASRLTWRLLGVIIDGLPGESLTKTAMRDELSDEDLAKLAKQRKNHGRWSHLELLVASLIDAVNALRTDMYRSRGAKQARYPDPWPRPGVPRKGAARRLTPAGLAYLQRLRDDHARLHPEPAEQVDNAGG